VIVDTTARAVFRVEGKKKLSLKKLDAALAKTGIRGLRARKLQRRKMPIPGATYKVKMDGFS